MRRLPFAALALFALALFSVQAVAQTDVTSAQAVNPCTRVTSPATGCRLVDASHPLPVLMSGGSVLIGNQSNAGPGTTGSANVGANAYGYGWNGAAWQQLFTGSQTIANSFAVTDQSLNTGGALYNAVIAPVPAQTSKQVDIGATESLALTTGGATPFHLTSSAASNNATLVSTGAHTLYDLQITTTATSVASVRLYDSASSPTCSSATGAVKSFTVIASTSAPLGGLVVPLPSQGVAFANGLAYCVTGAVADNDNTNAPTGVGFNGDYK